MILKKPYAFFIKNFKLFHLIIFFLTSILLYRTSLIYGFLKEYVKDSPNVIGKELTNTLFANWTYILVILLIIINIIIIIVMIRKEKPYVYYITNILLYIGILIIYSISNNIISDLETVLVPAKTTLAIRDITNLARLMQTVSVVFYLIRATGFDIKKFDFVRDLQSLDISEEDSEEYEVAVSFEGNETIRRIKRIIRGLKYYYLENKFMLNIIFLLFVGFLFLIIYLGSTKYDKVYKENEFIGVGTFDLGIKESYIIEKDYKNTKIVDNENILVVLKLSIKSNYEQKIPITRAMLVLNGYQYYHNINYAKNLIDIGTTYNNQTINEEFKDYILVYKVPRNQITSNMIFRYVDNIELEKGKTKVNSIDISINPNKIDSSENIVKTYELANEIDTSSSKYSDYKITINNYELSDSFISTYNTCITATECYDFKEIIKPTVTSSKAKTLLKLNGNITYENKINNITNLYDYINAFGSIEYKYNGKNYIEKNDFNNISFTKTKDEFIYIEVDKEIMYSEEIKLVFNIRNNKYEYILKGGKINE